MSEIAVGIGSGEKIPVIDFTGLTGGDLAVRKATAMSMREAFGDFGFIYLKNHSVPQSVIDELFARSIAFSFSSGNESASWRLPRSGVEWFGPDQAHRRKGEIQSTL